MKNTRKLALKQEHWWDRGVRLGIYNNNGGILDIRGVMCTFKPGQ